MAPTTQTTTAKTMRRTTTIASFGNVGILLCIVTLALAHCAAATNVPQAVSDAQPIAAITRVKRMYALCPPRFQRVGQQCYYMSATKMNWLDAHFDCKDRNSQLAEPLKLEDRRLRRFMQRNDTLHTPKWIGGLFNWQKNQWQWGYSGRDMDYQSFSQMLPGSSQDLKFHCAVLNADLKYRWSAKPCVELHHFVCQHNMPMVTDRNRHKVYAKWNASFPNEMANEMEVIVDQRYPGDRRRYVYQHSAAIAANTNSVRLTPPPPSAQRPTGHVFKPQQHKRRQDPFNNTLFGSNGRFSDRKMSQSVNFGDPHRRGIQNNRRRPKTTTATPSLSASATTSSPADAYNSLDANVDRQQEDARRLAAEQHTARIDAERRAKHKHDKEERRRRNRERKRQNELRRQQQHEQLMREQQERASTAAPAEIVTSSTTTTTTARTTAIPSAMEQSEALRLAESRRKLGIDGPAPPAAYNNDRWTTAQIPQTSGATATTAAARPSTDDSNNINDWDDQRRDEEERRIRAEEERQRADYERRQQDYQREQAEAERKRQESAQQQERERAEQETTRRRLEQERSQKEELIAAEERDRKEQERIAEEENARMMQERAEREQQRKQAEAERKRAKEEKAAEIRRLKEKAMRENNDTVAELEAEAEQRRAADEALQKAQLEKKLKRDRIHEKLRSMTPEQQMRFYAKRAERNQKRQTPTNTNEVVIPK